MNKHITWTLYALGANEDNSWFELMFFDDRTDWNDVLDVVVKLDALGIPVRLEPYVFETED